MPIQRTTASMPVGASADASQSDIFLHVQTKRAGKLKGEANSPDHQDDILVRSWSWGVSAATAVGAGQRIGRGAYKTRSVYKTLATSTTGLLSALASNDEVKE